jgi:parvulin-like peptidyl-prolyl isomerase
MGRIIRQTRTMALFVAASDHRAIARLLRLWTVLAVLLTNLPVAWTEELAVVARVNGETVSRSEWQRMMADPLMQNLYQREFAAKKTEPDEFKNWALRKLIMQRLVLQNAALRNLTVTEQEIDLAMAATRRRFKDVKKFQRWLRSRVLDDKSLRDILRADMVTMRLKSVLLSGVRATDDQVKEYYAAHRDEFKTTEQVRLRFVVVKEKTMAEEIMAALDKGGDFDRLAAERSAASGGVGDTGLVDPETLTPLLQDYLRILSVGETRGPLEAGLDGFLIVRLEERVAPKTKTLEEARSQVEQRVLAQEREKFLQSWLTEQEKQSKIEVFL